LRYQLSINYRIFTAVKYGGDLALSNCDRALTYASTTDIEAGMVKSYDSCNV